MCLRILLSKISTMLAIFCVKAHASQPWHSTGLMMVLHTFIFVSLLWCVDPNNGSRANYTLLASSGDPSSDLGFSDPIFTVFTKRYTILSTTSIVPPPPSKCLDRSDPLLVWLSIFILSMFISSPPSFALFFSPEISFAAVMCYDMMLMSSAFVQFCLLTGWRSYLLISL